MRLALAIWLLCAALVNAAILTVPSVAHSTIQSAANAAVAGDVVYVTNTGSVYNERVNLPNSGTAANPIAFVGVGLPVMRGFDISAKHYNRIIGFEITHVDTAVRGGIMFVGTCSNIWIIDNYIHDVDKEGMHLRNAAYAVVRGNTFYYIAHPGSIQIPDLAIAADSGAHHCLIEYNVFQRASDFLDIYGQFHIERNNHLHDALISYWTDIGTHQDFFQPGSDGQQTFTRHRVNEANFMGNNPGIDSHGIILQDNSGFGDTNYLIRGDVFYGIGGGGAGGFGVEFVQHYNNTFFANLTDAAPPIGNLINWYRDNPDGSMGGLLINTLVAHVGAGHDDIYQDVDNEIWMGNNWGFAANSEASYAGTSNPLFVDTNSLDFRLQSGSPVRGAGLHITAISSANGSGTSFVVTNTHRLKDGWGIVEGDVISFADSSTARIVAVDYETHTITVANSITWTQNQLVFWGALGYQKDIGAYPYGATFLTAATYSVNGGTATISTTGDARKCWQYRGGIPIAEDYDAPFTFTHTAGDTYKAYALYAQQNPVVNATQDGAPGQPGIGGGGIVGNGGFYGNGGVR